MKSAEIRQSFLNFFATKNHEVVPSSSLIPLNDPTLLFTNAGMVQFKDVFLGKEKRSCLRAVSSQRVVRAGGKHNDLENVGYTARHHTFFEMLGNFSFGNYFKREAIQYAWEFLTVTLQIPAERLWVSVFHEDKEAEEIWLNEIGIVPSRLSRLGEKDNFWAMGDTGPCGPCTEIFYDHGALVAGGPPGSAEADGDRYIEIWNLVFMQFNRDQNGKLIPLPKPSVDTGMGLERISAVMQHVHNNYDIDLFQNIISKIARVINCDDLKAQSLRVVADHIRSCCFLISDGILPSNEGRGYVLRRIIRRALRHGAKLGATATFFSQCVDALVNEMGVAYPELIKAKRHIEKTLLQEEERFIETLSQGMRIFEQDIAQLKSTVIPGKTVFTLYDTYGFPVDLTNDIARERGLSLDIEGFDHEMSLQKARSRAQDAFKNNYSVQITSEVASCFRGYETLSVMACLVEIISAAGEPLSTLSEGESGILILDQSAFYAESGGQIGDRGFIASLADDGSVFIVEDTQKYGNAILHKGHVRAGYFNLKMPVLAEVDHSVRQAIRKNHSATHLLHAALRKVLGEHVAQKGSLVSDQRLRFDFSHMSPISLEHLQEIEQLVNGYIQGDSVVTTEKMSREQAQEKGAMALFNEKYDSEVRVLFMGVIDEEDAFSIELCGGTHVSRLGEIGLLNIISETGIASGVRRIEAVTGMEAVQWVQQQAMLLSLLSNSLKSPIEKLPEKVALLLEGQKKADKEIDKLNQKLALYMAGELLEKTKLVKGVKVLIAQVSSLESSQLKDLTEQCKKSLVEGCVLLACVKEGKVSLAAGVTLTYIDHISAGKWVGFVAQLVGGKGGGRPDFAMAGGSDSASLNDALLQAEKWIIENIDS